MDAGAPDDDAQGDGDGAADDDAPDFYERRIGELEASLPRVVRRKSALAEYGLSTPSLVLLALSLLLLVGTKVLGPGWLFLLANGKGPPSAGGG